MNGHWPKRILEFLVKVCKVDSSVRWERAICFFHDSWTYYSEAGSGISQKEAKKTYLYYWAVEHGERALALSENGFPGFAAAIC